MSGAITGVILAGGKSLRMGRDKASLEIGGESVLYRLVRRLQPICSGGCVKEQIERPSDVLRRCTPWKFILAGELTRMLENQQHNEGGPTP